MENHHIHWYVKVVASPNPNIIRLAAKALMKMLRDALAYNNLAASKWDAFRIAVLDLI